MAKSAFLSALALLLASVAFAQITWQPLNGPTGVSDLKIAAVDPSGRIFLRHNQDLFTSTDNGDSWISSAAGIPANERTYISTLLVLPTGKVVAETNNKYYQYDSALNSWSLNSQFTGSGTLSLDDQQRLWRVAGENIYYSTDEGQSFELVLEVPPAGGSYGRMANHDDQHNLVVVVNGTQGQLYHFTTDGTVTLIEPLSGGVDYLGYNPFSGTAFRSNSQQSWRLVDGSLTWEEITLKVLPTDIYSARIKQLFCESAAKIWAFTDWGLFRSEDGGANWAPFQLNNSGIHQFYRAPDGTLFLSQECSDNDFLRSTDQGQTWMDISESFTYSTVHNILVARNEVLYARTCYQYDRSTDGGQNWSPAILADSLPTRIRILAVHPDGALFSISADSLIIRSADGGHHWNMVNQPTSLPWNNHSSSLQTDPFGNLYAFYSYSDSYKSTDKGQTWQPIRFSPHNPYNAFRFLFHPSGDIYLIKSFVVEHYLADQDTSMIEPINTPNSEIIKIEWATITAQGSLLFSGYPSLQHLQLYRYTSDEGLEPLNFPGHSPRAITTTPDGLIFIVSKDSIFQSDNEGLQWTLAGKMPYDLQPLSLQVGNDQHLYVSYYYRVIYRSTMPLTPRNLIAGVAWYDENDNCIREANEPPLVNHYVQAQGSADYGGYAYTNGQYRIFAPDGTYQVSAVAPNALFEACPPVSVTVNAQNDTVPADLALRAAVQCPYLRVSASTPLLRRCFPNTYTVRYANEGTATAIGASIELTLDSLFHFLSASVPPTSQSGQVLSFALGDLLPGASGQLRVQVEVSCFAALQQVHCFKAQVFPGTPCLPGLTDLSVTEECRANVGSFDPNDKRAFVAGDEEPGTILPDQAIEYLIRFQNTGTDTAFTVVVEDRLSGVLDLASVTPLVSSHPFRMELGPERNLRFVFDQILLPDSNINEAASHGFIKFAVRQLPDLPSGTAIHNAAAIYFDFNAAVATNTSELVVTRPTGVYEPRPGYSVQAFPNPFHDLLHFRVSGPAPLSGWTLLLMDATGRLVQQEQFTGSTAQLSRQGLPIGMYFYVVLGERGQWVAAGRVMAD